MMKKLPYMLLTAAMFSTTTLVLAAEDVRPERESSSAEQMRQRPDDNRPSRYPNTDIKPDSTGMKGTEPPENGSAMDMNDT
ncbi:MAG TPA: hypothetical protein VFX01_00040, partial [Methylophilaceae bacterium]|nr:hypothetical protein [Methylophilaceae bacterium]